MTPIEHQFIPKGGKYFNSVCLITDPQITQNKIEQLCETFHPSQFENCTYMGRSAYAFINPTETQIGMLKLFKIEFRSMPIKQFASQYSG